MSMHGCYRRVTREELDALRAEPVALAAFLFPPGDVPPPVDRALDIGNDWQAIHFLLTGDPWAGGGPEAKAVLGGEPISDEDLIGHGPARGLDPEDVAAVAAVLEAVSPAELLSRYDPAAFHAGEVYPGGWDHDPDRERVLAEHYAALRELFAATASQGEALILYLA
jgi:hypothetical protein